MRVVEKYHRENVIHVRGGYPLYQPAILPPDDDRLVVGAAGQKRPRQIPAHCVNTAIMPLKTENLYYKIHKMYHRYKKQTSNVKEC